MAKLIQTWVFFCEHFRINMAVSLEVSVPGKFTLDSMTLSNNNGMLGLSVYTEPHSPGGRSNAGTTSASVSASGPLHVQTEHWVGLSVQQYSQ